MRKMYLITTMLLLSAVWVVAQTTPSTPQSTTPGAAQPASPQSASPSSTLPSQQPAAPDTTQTSQNSNDSSASIEGCLNGSAGSFTLTDQTGKSWQLAGDTSKLSDHVGHQVRISGSEAGKSGGDSSSAASGGASSSAGSQ